MMMLANEAITVRLTALQQTVSLDSEAFLVERLETRLGPVYLREFPPTPARLQYTSVLSGGLRISLPPLRLIVLSLLTVLLFGTVYTLTIPRSSKLAFPPITPVRPTATVELQQVASLPTPTIPPVPSVPSDTATAVPSPTTQPLPEVQPTQAPVLPSPTVVVRRVYYAPPTNTPKPVPTDTPNPTNTPWWPNLGMPATPIRVDITPTPGTGVGGNDWCQSCYDRSGTIK